MKATPAESSPQISALHPTERILWSGQPNPISILRSQVAVILFGAGWLAISLSCLVDTLRQGHAVGAIMLLVFVAIGLFVALSPFYESATWRRTIYIITNERLLISSSAGRVTKSIRLSSIANVERIDRSGAITLKIPMSFIDGGEGETTRYVTLHAPAGADIAYKLLTGVRRQGSSAHGVPFR
jgi:hypothetical protein